MRELEENLPSYKSKRNCDAIVKTGDRALRKSWLSLGNECSFSSRPMHE
jgi:hypothetical protein